MRVLLIALVLLLLVPHSAPAQPASSEPAAPATASSASASSASASTAPAAAASASPASAAPATHPPAPPAPGSALTPAQARAALDVLNDPKKRAEVTATLEAIAKAQPLPAGPPAAAPAAAGGNAATTTLPIPLAPNSLGAQVLIGAEQFLNRASSETNDALHAMQSLPSLWGWVVVMSTNPWARGMLVDVAWRVIVALLCGLAVDFGLRAVLRRPIAALEGVPASPGTSPGQRPGTSPGQRPAASDTASQAAADDADTATGGRPETRYRTTRRPPEEPSDQPPQSPDDAVERAEAGDVEPPDRRSRRLPAAVMLHRVPIVIARLGLDLIPVIGFALAGHLVAGTDLGGSPSSSLIVLAVVDAYAVCAGLLGIAHMLLSPNAPRLRLFHVPDSLALYLMRWTRRLIIIAVFGYAIAEVGLLLGLSDLAHSALQKAFGFVLHACLAIIVLQKRRAVRRWLRAPPGNSGTAARMRNALAAVWHWIALFFIVGIWLVWAVEIPDGFSRLLHFCVVTTLLLIGARLTLILLIGLLDRVLSVPPETAARYPGLEARLRLYHPALSALLRAIIYVLCVLAILQLYGFGAFTWFGESELGHRIVSAIGTLVVTLLLALAAWEATNAAIQRHLAKLAKDQQLARSARLRTLLPLMRSTLMITILVVAGMMVLSEIGINIAPLLAGAGIIGVAIGFGSQKLVQDLITGIFLLLENAMQVGDTVTVSGLSGVVEALSVRTIRLRAGDGSVNIIPFSAVTTVNNVNRGLGNASVNVTVDYAEDTDRVAAVLAEIVSGMRAEPAFAGQMLSDLQLWGVDKVDGAEATIVGQMVCTDSGRWSVQREFNRRMKKRFQELGIRLYNPTRNVAVTVASMGPADAPPAGASEAGRPGGTSGAGSQVEEPQVGERRKAERQAGEPRVGEPQPAGPSIGERQANAGLADAGQTGAGQTGAGQTGAGQTGAAQTGAAQTGAGQTGAAQTGASQADASRTDASQAGASQADAGRTGGRTATAHPTAGTASADPPAAAAAPAGTPAEPPAGTTGKDQAHEQSRAAD